MQTQFGGNWYAGRQVQQYHDTYNFIRSQPDLIDYYINARQLDNKDSLYDIVAAAQARYDKLLIGSNFTLSTTGYELQQEIMTAGRQARSEGKSFSA